MSSASPRNKVIAACVWALTSPGIRTCSGRSTVHGGLKSGLSLRNGQHGNNTPIRDGDGMVFKDLPGHALRGTHQRGRIRVSQCCMVAAVYASHRTAPALRFSRFQTTKILRIRACLWYYFRPVNSLEIRIILTFGFRLPRGGAALGF